jgi:hypothetical protein
LPSVDLTTHSCVELVEQVGERGALLSIDKAGRTLGHAPEHSWRDWTGPHV